MQYHLTDKQRDLILRDLEECRIQDQAADRRHSVHGGNGMAKAQRDERARVRRNVMAILRGQRPLTAE